MKCRRGLLFSLVACLFLIGGMIGLDRVWAADGGLTVSQAQKMCPSCTVADQFGDLYTSSRVQGVAFKSANPLGSTFVLTPGHALNGWFMMPDGTYAGGSAQSDTESITVEGVLSADIIQGSLLDLPLITPHLVDTKPTVTDTTRVDFTCNGSSASVTVITTHPFDLRPTIEFQAQNECTAVGS